MLMTFLSPNEDSKQSSPGKRKSSVFMSPSGDQEDFLGATFQTQDLSSIQKVLSSITKNGAIKENMKAIETNKALLNQFVDGLDERLGGCMGHHDEVLLKMFRFHISTIKKEFKELLEENFNLKNRPVDLSEIEKSVYFLKEECLRLSERQEKARNTIAELQRALKERDQSIEFMKKQVHVSAKQAHLLKIALECKTSELDKMEETEALREKEKKIVEKAMEIVASKGPNLISGSFCFQINTILAKRKKKIKKRDPVAQPWEEIFEEACSLGAQQQDSFNTKSISFEREIAQLKRELASAKSKLFCFLASLNNIQQVFLNCIEATKKHEKYSPDITPYKILIDETFISSVDLNANSTNPPNAQQRAEAFRAFIENDDVRKAFLELFNKKHSVSFPQKAETIEQLTGFKSTVIKRKLSLPGSRSANRSRSENKPKERPGTSDLARKAQINLGPSKEQISKKRRLHFGNLHTLIQKSYGTPQSNF